MKIEQILEKGVLVLPQLHLWSGRRHVKVEELGITLPKGVVTPGSKRIFPPDAIKEFSTIKSQMLTAIEKDSVKFGRGAYCLDTDLLPELIKKLEELEKRWDQLLNSLRPSYDAMFDAWLPTINPAEWQPIIEKAKIGAAEACSKYAFRYALLRLEAPEGQDGVNNSMVSGLVGQLWDELAEIAANAEENLFGKEKVTQRARGPFHRIAQKAVSVSFIDPTAKRLASYIEDQLDHLPKTGPIEGQDLSHLQVLIHNLADAEKARSLAKAFGSTASSFEYDVEEAAEEPKETAQSIESAPVNEPAEESDEGTQKVFF